MISELYCAIGRVLLAVTISLLFGITLAGITLGFGTIQFNERLCSFEFIGLMMIITIMAYLLFAPKNGFSKRELAGHAPKYGEQREFNAKEIEALESEAEFVKQAREYFDNKENYK